MPADLDREKLVAFASEHLHMLNEDALAREADDPEDDTALRMRGGAATWSVLLTGISSGWFDRDDWPRVPIDKIAPEVKTKVRRHAPGTSWDAALAQTPEKSVKLYKAIMIGLRAHKGAGLTDDELRAVLKTFIDKYQLAPESVTMRRGELRDAGWVRDTGKKRPSDLGASMTVWEAVPEETT